MSENKTIDYRMLTLRSPLYEADRWRRICALARGGGVVDDLQVLRELLPMLEGEDITVYELRLRNAYHIPYVGRLIGQIVSSLSTDPLSVVPGVEGEGIQPPDSDPYWWYPEFSKDVSAPGGECQDMSTFMARQARTALLCRRAWTLVDLPEAGDERPKTLAEERIRGNLESYLCAVDPADVIWWEWDPDGDSLLWALVRDVRRPRTTLSSDGNTVEETFTCYTAEDWTRYVYRYKEDQPPTPDKVPDETTSGPHSFGKVPLVPFELPEDLWFGAVLESPAIELFRKMNALSWAENRGLFAVLVQTESSSPGAAEAKELGGTPPLHSQTAGPGHVLSPGPGGDLKYVAPPAHVYEVAQKQVIHLRDELYRLVNQIAMSANNTGAALGRSAESKGLDLSALTVLLGEIGKRVREHTDRVLETVSTGRGDDVSVKTNGMQEFEIADLGQLVEEAEKVIGRPDGKGIQISSPTFVAGYAFEAARRLWPAATREDLDQIRKELSSVGSKTPSDGTSSGSMEVPGRVAAEGPEGTGGATETAYAQLQEDFEPDSIGWVREADWQGPRDVPLDEIDFSNMTAWKAYRDTKKVAKFVRKIRGGFKKPVVLVQGPDGGKFRVADGHHRALAYRRLRTPARALVAKIADEGTFLKAMEMHAEQKDQN